jgi:hypothetical protein
VLGADFEAFAEQVDGLGVAAAGQGDRARGVQHRVEHVRQAQQADQRQGLADQRGGGVGFAVLQQGPAVGVQHGAHRELVAAAAQEVDGFVEELPAQRGGADVGLGRGQDLQRAGERAGAAASQAFDRSAFDGQRLLGEPAGQRPVTAHAVVHRGENGQHAAIRGR